jgi:hypothetical protein
VRYLIRAVGGADRQGDRQAAGRLSVRRKADCRPRHHPRQLDPTDPVHCTVAFGSHNLSYKASYSNDENLVVDQALTSTTGGVVGGPGAGPRWAE